VLVAVSGVFDLVSAEEIILLFEKANEADKKSKQAEIKKKWRIGVYTLNLKCTTSPSCTIYSLPSKRHLPASLAPASPLLTIKSS